MKRFLYFTVFVFLIASCSDNYESINKVHSQIEKLAPSKMSNLNWIGHWQDEGDRERLVKEVARVYEFENQEINVNLKFISQIAENRSKMAMADEIYSMITTGNYTWDVIWLDDIIYSLVAQKLDNKNWGQTYLVDFAKLDWFKETQKDFIISDSYYRNLTGNIIPGPYIEGFYYSIWYNQEVADKIGIDIQEQGMTAQDLLDYASKISAYNSKNSEYIALLYESKNRRGTSTLFQNLFLSELEGNNSDSLKALTKTLKYMQELSVHKPLLKEHREADWFATTKYPLEGKCLFYIEGTWMYNLWKESDGDSYKKMMPAELPVFNKSNTYPGGYIPTFAVLKNAPNKENGIKLLKYWSSSDVAERWAAYTKSPTGLKGDLSRGEFSLDKYEKFQLEISKKYGRNMRFYPDPSYALGKSSQVGKKDFEDIIVELLAGNMSYLSAVEKLNLN